MDLINGGGCDCAIKFQDYLFYVRLLQVFMMVIIQMQLREMFQISSFLSVSVGVVASISSWNCTEFLSFEGRILCDVFHLIFVASQCEVVRRCVEVQWHGQCVYGITLPPQLMTTAYDCVPPGLIGSRLRLSSPQMVILPIGVTLVNNA
jgi:hypothetical protein